MDDGGEGFSMVISPFFFLIQLISKNHLFIWLHWVFVATREFLPRSAHSVACELSYPAACGTLVP